MTDERTLKFVQNCGQVPGFLHCFNENCAEVDDVKVIAYGAHWYKMGLSENGVPYPTTEQVECDKPISERDIHRTVWNFCDLGIEYVVTDVMRSMFYTWGQGDPNYKKEWFTIDFDGNSNYSITDFSPTMIRRYMAVLNEWIEKGTGKMEFTICAVNKIDDRRCGFNKYLAYNSANKERFCPFSQLFSTRARKYSCCYTVICEGIMLDQIEHLFGECYERQITIDQHEDYATMITWLTCMHNFWEKRV